MKTIDEREMQKKQKNKQSNKKRQKGARGTEAMGNGWELDDFVVHLS